MRTSHLQALGIQEWQLRSPAAIETVAAENISQLVQTPCQGNWDTLQAAVAACTTCELHKTRTQTVFGVGDKQAKLMLIGEAPGFNEDEQGEPFVGRAGQLLNMMLGAIQLNRSQVYIANILKCRPPNNRDPDTNEVASCTPFLNQQIELIKPQLLVAVGRISAHYLLQTKSSLESLRNKLHHYGENRIPLIATYHPAYLLRNPADKKKAFADLQVIRKTLESNVIAAK